MKINSVLGEISTEELGFTLMHEHIMIANHTMRQMWPDWINIDEFVQYAKNYIARAQRLGVNTVVDATAFQLGRDARVLKRVSEESGLNIIACTGYFWNHDISLVDKGVDILAKILTHDIEKGMEGTDIKAGIIKCGSTGDVLTAQDRLKLEATAIAHKATGVPIFTHCGTMAGAVSQMDFFDEQGVAPSKVMIGHIGDWDDVEFLKSVAERGYYIGHDRMGVDTRHPEQLASKIRIENIIKLWKDGYLEKTLCSHDASIYIDYWEGREDMGCPWEMYKTLDLDKVEFKYTFIHETVIPQLKAAGMTDEDIDTLFVANPRKFFEN